MGTFKDLSHQGVKILPQRGGFAFILFVLCQQCQQEAFAYYLYIVYLCTSVVTVVEFHCEAVDIQYVFALQ